MERIGGSWARRRGGFLLKDTDGLFEGGVVGVRARARHWGPPVVHGTGHGTGHGAGDGAGDGAGGGAGGRNHWLVDPGKIDVDVTF